MNLYLLRHGIAVEHGAAGYPDAERPLTRNGRNKLRCVAAALKRMEVKFDMIISSPLARARQTAELVARQLNATKSVTISRHLEPGSRIPGAVRHLHRLKTKPKNILLVGHEPDLSRLAAWLLTGNDGLALTFRKGGLCKLTLDESSRDATLEWLLTPKQMGLMA